MSRFAFLVHPLEMRTIADRYPLLRGFPSWLIEFLLLFKGPQVVGRTDSIYTSLTRESGQGIDGLFVGVPLTPRLIKKLPTWFVEWRIQQALCIARAEGARVAGLGALLACVGDNGISINRRSPMPVTTGNSLTVEMAIQAAQRLSNQMFAHIPRSNRVLAVVGASGAIGQACAEILKDEFGSLVLVVRDEAKGYQVAKEIGLKETTFSVVTNPAFIHQAHVVISVTSDESEVIMPEDLAPGTVVVDVARPRDVSVRVAKERSDVLVIEGGVVAVPGLPRLGLDFGFNQGHAYACMCETMILAAQGMLDDARYQAYTVGKKVTAEMALEMGRLAYLHDFKLTGYRSFEREVSQGDLDAFQKIAAQRKAWKPTPSIPTEP